VIARRITQRTGSIAIPMMGVVATFVISAIARLVPGFTSNVARMEAAQELGHHAFSTSFVLEFGKVPLSSEKVVFLCNGRSDG
jgi:hypothetical protein